MYFQASYLQCVFRVANMVVKQTLGLVTQRLFMGAGLVHCFLCIKVFQFSEVCFATNNTACNDKIQCCDTL